MFLIKKKCNRLHNYAVMFFPLTLCQVSYADARDASEIPGLPSIPIFGSMLSFAPFGDLNMAKRIEMSTILYKGYGPILQMRLPVFPGRTVFLFDPADMEKVFRLHLTILCTVESRDN